MNRITDNELQEFCKWYSSRFAKREDVESVFVTCMCGHFHSTPKAMLQLLKRMAALGLIKKQKNKITIL